MPVENINLFLTICHAKDFAYMHSIQSQFTDINATLKDSPAQYNKYGYLKKIKIKK